MQKTDLRKISKDARAQLRKVAIRMFLKNKTRVSIAKELGINRELVIIWIQKYKQTGKIQNQENKRGRTKGDNRTLSTEQENHIQKLIIDKTPDQLKLEFALWSARAVRILIKQEFSIKMPDRTVRLYLSRWGFTPQKPIKRAYEQQPEQVKEFLDKTYPFIKAQAKQENALIHWADETGLSSIEHNVRGYAPKGKTPILVTSYKARERVNMISSITNQGRVRFMVYQDKFTARVFIKFIKQLIKDSDRKIYLILDNLRVHHAKIVRAFVEKNKEHIKLFFLPPYSPELNPDEYLNCDLKAKISQDKPTREKGQMKKKLIKHMRSIQKQPKRVMSYFQHERISYAS